MTEAFPTSGNIDPKVFPFLLMDLHRRGATGSLKVDGPAYPKALYLRGGRILFGSSNDPKDQLGSILIENGKISPEQLEDVNTKVGPGNPLAKVLAESGYVNQRELGEAARIKVERILSDVIAYTSGSFEFEDGVLPKGAVDLKLSTERLLLAAVGRIPDRGFVLRHLSSLGVVLKPVEGLSPRLLEIGLEAGGLPERLDGHRTLKEAAALTRLDEFEAAKVACSLLFLGLVTRGEESAGAGAEGAAGELDLAQTARAAFEDDSRGEPLASLGAGSEQPFFVSETAPAPPASGHASAAEPPIFSSSEPPSFPMPEPESPMVLETAPAVAETEPAPFPDHAAFVPPPEPAAFAAPGAESEPPTIPFGALPSDASADTPEQPSGFEIDTTPGFTPSAPMLAPASTPDTFEDVTPPTPADRPEEDLQERVAPSRPSKDDLAALDALLNPSGSGASLASAEKARPQERWEPHFRPTAARASRRQNSHVLAWVLAGLGVAIAAAGAWFYAFGATVSLPWARKTPAPAPTAARPTVAAVPAEPPTTSPSTPPSATAPATPEPAPPSRIATPPPAPPTPAPTASVAAPASDAHSLLQSGSYPEGARAFVSSLKKSGARFSIQILVACSTETIQKANESAGAQELYILPVNFKGRSCYRLCWGFYETEEEAAAALRALPEYFRKGGATPRVVPVAGILN
jgi:hypothetical protein